MGLPRAAVVFAGEVDGRTREDARLRALGEAMAQAGSLAKVRLRAEWNQLYKAVHSEKLGEMADEFDRVHSVHRALKVGALHHIIPPESLRPYLIHAVERGIEKELELGSEKADTLNSVEKTVLKEQAATV